jgi:hypothetical protein
MKFGVDEGRRDHSDAASQAARAGVFRPSSRMSYCQKRRMTCD